MAALCSLACPQTLLLRDPLCSLVQVVLRRLLPTDPQKGAHSPVFAAE